MATKPPMPPARPASAASAPEDAATRRIRMIAEDREKRAAMGRSYDAAAKNSMNPDGGMKHGGKVKKYEKGGDVDPLEKANKEFEANRKSEDKSDALGDFIAMNTAAKGSAEPYDKTFVDEDVKPKASAPKPKPTLKMGTAEGFKKHGGTRTEYMNMLNNLKPRGLAKPSSARDGSAQNARFVEMARVEDERLAEKAADMKLREKEAKDNYAKSGPTDINSIMKARLQPKKYASGGSVTRGDGCAQRGKTRGMMR